MDLDYQYQKIMKFGIVIFHIPSPVKKLQWFVLIFRTQKQCKRFVLVIFVLHWRNITSARNTNNYKNSFFWESFILLNMTNTATSLSTKIVSLTQTLLRFKVMKYNEDLEKFFVDFIFLITSMEIWSCNEWFLYLYFFVINFVPQKITYTSDNSTLEWQLGSC